MKIKSIFIICALMTGIISLYLCGKKYGECHYSTPCVFTVDMFDTNFGVEIDSYAIRCEEDSQKIEDLDSIIGPILEHIWGSEGRLDDYNLSAVAEGARSTDSDTLYVYFITDECLLYEVQIWSASSKHTYVIPCYSFSMERVLLKKGEGTDRYETKLGDFVSYAGEEIWDFGSELLFRIILSGNKIERIYINFHT